MTYSIVWVPYSPMSHIGLVLGLRESASLPHLLDGENERTLKQGQPARYDARTLVQGILVAGPTGPDFALVVPEDEALSRLLDLIAQDLYAPSSDEFVASVAAHIRERHGQWVALAALRRGVELLHAARVARGDLVVSNWFLAHEAPDECAVYMRQVVIAAEPLTPADVAACSNRDAVLYAYLAALTYLGELEQRARAQQTYAMLIDESEWLNAQVVRLWSVPSGSLEDLALT